MLTAAVFYLCSLSNATACAVALLLAHDVSHSVSYDEYDLQTAGHAAAFRDPEIQQLIQEIGGAAVMLIHWSGNPHQEVMIGWRRIRSKEQIEAFADALAVSKPSMGGFGTAIGDMLKFATTLWTAETESCDRRVLDISGDGRNNDGGEIAPPRQALLRAGVTINGLTIQRFDVPLNPGIRAYYEEQVIGGPGAFAMEARGFKDYSRAFKEKLKRELRSPSVADAR